MNQPTTKDMLLEAVDKLKAQASSSLKRAFFKHYAPHIKDLDGLSVVSGENPNIPKELIETDWFNISEHVPKGEMFIVGLDTA